MIVVKTPLRVTLGGGGSDLPDNPDGLCITATINKYIYSMVSRPFTDEIIVHHHTGTERVREPKDVQHRLLRAVIGRTGVFPVEFSGVSEIPAGTGLGSSSAFAVGAIHALRAHVGHLPTRLELAREAAAIEVHVLKDPIGYQDQYACALGGIRWMRFNNGTVETEEVCTDHATWNKLNRNLRLYYTGVQRDAANQMGHSPSLDILKDQAEFSLMALRSGDLDAFAHGLTQQWVEKLQAAPTDIHYRANEWIMQGIRQGALGGKLVGAGNGGFLLFYTPVPLDLGLREVPINLTLRGTEIIA